MSSILSSHGLVLAITMAVSGTVILLSLFRENNFPPTQLSGNHEFHPTRPILRSCLSSDGNRRERKKKRVRFADSVKDSRGNGEEFRKGKRELREVRSSCGIEFLGIGGMPANRVALYNGFLKDRVQRMECSH